MRERIDRAKSAELIVSSDDDRTSRLAAVWLRRPAAISASRVAVLRFCHTKLWRA